MDKQPNRLSEETSPYLLQHAFNPVYWFPWGEEALEKAVRENKPILLSIGYSACHWCHVMERESFEDPVVADFMNQNFVCIKVDREERPDLDQIYMDAVQAITGSGGWPLNVFLTPGKKPFYGGTYYPPRPAHGRPSWSQVLSGVAEAYQKRRDSVFQQAEVLLSHIQSTDKKLLSGADKERQLSERDALSTIFQNLLDQADRVNGGFGSPPKFPHFLNIRFLLYYFFTYKEKKALEHATHSLNTMLYGGIYDQLEGGIARYSTDEHWLVPHFEKMLYDNAMFIDVLAEAYRLTSNPEYARVMEQTISFLQNNFRHPDGGYFSALDADSEGAEGTYYIWSHQEVTELLGKDAPLVQDFFGITEAGNWEGSNILTHATDYANLSKEYNITESRVKEIIAHSKEKLLSHRKKRPAPGLDDKILLFWNALFATALHKAGLALSRLDWIEEARTLLQFLLEKFSMSPSLGFGHSYKEGVLKIDAFLEDYAALIDALLEIGQHTTNYSWIEIAGQLTAYVIKNFGDEKDELFYTTSNMHTDVILRKVDYYDNATPSGNALMCHNLLRLGALFNNSSWQERSRKMFERVTPLAVRHPLSLGLWSEYAFLMESGISEIAILGKGAEQSVRELKQRFLPQNVTMIANAEVSEWSLLRNRFSEESTQFFLCQNYSCKVSLTNVEEFYRLFSD